MEDSDLSGEKGRLGNLPRKDQTIRDYKMSFAQQAQYNDGEAVPAGDRESEL